MHFFVELWESQGAALFKTTLDYAQKGIPINLECVTVQPLDERGVYVFDKNTVYKQQCSLRDIQDHGRRTRRELTIPYA